MDTVLSILAQSFDPAVRGWLHVPHEPRGDGLVLTHGAGSNASAPLLVALAETFCGNGYAVLRCDLPYRQQRAAGPPFPGQAERDRAGLRNAVIALRKLSKLENAGKIFLGGHSYGGRQSTILSVDEPDLVSGLLLLSYPLHPPRKPEQQRTAHWPNLRTPCLFVQGTRDPFGSIEEIEQALPLIPARHELMVVEGTGHDLGFKGAKARATEKTPQAKESPSPLPARIYAKFDEMFG